MYLTLLHGPACFGLTSLILALDSFPRCFASVDPLRLPLKIINFMTGIKSLHYINKTIAFIKVCDYSTDTLHLLLNSCIHSFLPFSNDHLRFIIAETSVIW